MFCDKELRENNNKSKCTRCGECEQKPLIIRNECGNLQMNEDVPFNGHKIIYEKLHSYEQTGLSPSEIDLYVKCQAHNVSQRELQLRLEVDHLKKNQDKSNQKCTKLRVENIKLKELLDLAIENIRDEGCRQWSELIACDMCNTQEEAEGCFYSKINFQWCCDGSYRDLRKD